MQDSGPEPADDDVFAYSNVLVDGENISKLKKDAHIAKTKKPVAPPKKEKFDEDAAIADYSMDLADDQTDDDQGGISLAKKMISGKKDQDPADDEDDEAPAQEDK